jgi:hypothetical protein
MDLSALEPVEGATIALRHPVSNEPLSDDKGPLTIDIVGVDSPKFQARQRLLTNKLATSGNRKSKLTAEDLEEEGIATVAACIAGWSPNVEPTASHWSSPGPTRSRLSPAFAGSGNRWTLPLPTGQIS